MTATGIQTSTVPTGEGALARRASGLFLGSFAGFVGIVVASVLDADRDAAQREAAEELGVNLNHLPPEVLARILREDSSNLAVFATILFALLSVVLFAFAVWTLVGVAGQRRNLLAGGAVALAVAGGVAWLGVNASEVLLRFEPGWLVDNWWIYMTLVATFVVAACLALILAVLRLWGTGLARRTAVVVIVVSALTVVAQLTVNAPPIVPMLLGAIYAFNVKRSVLIVA
jgi:8-oxo-dGTP pyrophosphatase MutT (NUDIX family)